MARRISLVDISGRRRRFRRLFFWGGIAAGILIIVSGALWVATRSTLFILKDIKVEGTKHVLPEEVLEFMRSHRPRGLLTGFMNPENMLLWPGDISGEELKEFPAVIGIKTDKNYLRRTVSIHVSERERAGIWCFKKAEPQDCFWFDPAGVLFMSTYFAEGNLIPVLADYSRDPLQLGETALAPRLLPNLLAAFEALRLAPVSVKEVALKDLSLEEVEVSTYDGPRLLFSLRFPVSGLSDAMAAVSRITPLQDLQYIDFRVQNKVYYK